MRRKRTILAVAAAVLAIAVSGCAENQIPELSDEQAKAIGEYVAFTMMKYDTSHRSRLMDLSEDIYNDSVQPSPPSQTETPEEQEPSGMGPVDDTPVVDPSGTGTGSGNAYSMEEVMGLPDGVSVSFAGQTVCDSYPNDSDIMAGTFSVDAGAGKKLLVLKFRLANITEQKIDVDLASSGARYRVTVNDEYTRWALETAILPDDMACFQDTLSGGGEAETVLIIEVDENIISDLSSVRLSVKNESKVYTIQLTE